MTEGAPAEGLKAAVRPKWEMLLPASSEAAPQTDEMEGSELGDLEYGSVQGENNQARSAGSSYRLGILELELVLRRRRLGVLWPCLSPGHEGGGMAAALRRARQNWNFKSLLPSGCGPLRSNPINLRVPRVLPGAFSTPAALFGRPRPGEWRLDGVVTDATGAVIQPWRSR